MHTVTDNGYTVILPKNIRIVNPWKGAYMQYILELTSSEMEIVQSALKADWGCVTELLCENMRSKDKLPKNFEDFLVYRACHLDKVLDKIEELIA